MKNNSIKDKEVKDGCGGHIIAFAIISLLYFFKGFFAYLLNLYAYG